MKEQRKNFSGGQTPDTKYLNTYLNRGFEGAYLLYIALKTIHYWDTFVVAKAVFVASSIYAIKTIFILF
jgi:hypothetical protein